MNDPTFLFFHLVILSYPTVSMNWRGMQKDENSCLSQASSRPKASTLPAATISLSPEPQTPSLLQAQAFPIVCSPHWVGDSTFILGCANWGQERNQPTKLFTCMT